MEALSRRITQRLLLKYSPREKTYLRLRLMKESCLFFHWGENLKLLENIKELKEKLLIKISRFFSPKFTDVREEGNLDISLREKEISIEFFYIYLKVSGCQVFLITAWIFMWIKLGIENLLFNG